LDSLGCYFSDVNVFSDWGVVQVYLERLKYHPTLSQVSLIVAKHFVASST
jgi:predicted regulator of amino acid metabolism with ACT domain